MWASSSQTWALEDGIGVPKPFPDLVKYITGALNTVGFQSGIAACVCKLEIPVTDQGTLAPGFMQNFPRPFFGFVFSISISLGSPGTDSRVYHGKRTCDFKDGWFDHLCFGISLKWWSPSLWEIKGCVNAGLSESALLN